MSDIDQLLQNKLKELNYIKQIRIQSDELLKALNGITNNLDSVSHNVEDVVKIMNNWDAIIKSVSASSISLLQYQEKDYEVNHWKPKDTKNINNNQNGEDKNEQAEDPNNDDIPLPETMVRIRVLKDEDATEGGSR
ncbi:related to DASH complex subunit DAD2 [Saccharomycodes ludwigii]|uniref:DASH complex subunit DAD2 n=1 Tax=Saccharomycodes ludwigii TaxID=36035 RepID=A0A376B587_9ASCO|nr:hypothetical protein SCDLUD_003136 [Saccharomycodes ludwigii]KAH3900166.1 hypothetical protein SCDLUD_003136 [Saccharomycodes ludwigii]SSD59848.1 related to DASH complex subunit DAD2 [Saccharomycodes ludwigii]